MAVKNLLRHAVPIAIGIVSASISIIEIKEYKYHQMRP
jgi:hypothetical protein